MKQTWRWFGPNDEISIGEIVQTGAAGIVTALHHIPTGGIWPVEEIRKRQTEIAAPIRQISNAGQAIGEVDGHSSGSAIGLDSGLAWDVVESVPVSEAIKSQTGPYREHIAAYKQTLLNLAQCGIHTVCYNFMPVLDWTRTELSAPLNHGGTNMRFDLIDFVLFDCFILERDGAAEDYSKHVIESAKERIENMTEERRLSLNNNIVAGLPGTNDNWTLDEVKDHLQVYQKISADKLRSNLVDFLSEIVPTAESVGIRLCCHPDDPPFPLLGLPRVMSNQSDYEYVMSAVNSTASGVTFCTGSLGVAADFNPIDFINSLGSRIHFVHLRNTTREAPFDGIRCSFHESEHLGGDTDIASTVHALLSEEERRRRQGCSDHIIPMRPDHGQAIISDLQRPVMPGYPLIGRMRGLAELRGIMAGYEAFHS